MIILKVPETDQDINFIHMLWNDEATMEAVGGSANTSYDEVKEWIDYVSHSPSYKGLYKLIFAEGEPVGEVSFKRYDPVTKEAWFNIKILHVHRGKGYAMRAAVQLLREFFTDFNGARMLDDMSITNVHGQKFLEKLGFVEIERTDEVVLFVLDRETFFSKYV